MARPEGDDPDVLYVAEETLRVDKREVERARVRVSTVTETVEEIVGQELRSTRAEIDRVAIGRTLEAGEAAQGPRTENGVTIIPVYEEVVVVETRLVLKEELHIRQHTVVEDIEVPVTLRKQRVVVEETPPEDNL